MRIYVWLQTQLLLGSNFFLPDLWQPSLCTTSLGCQRLFLLYINKEIFKYFSIQNMLSKIYSNTFICHLGKHFVMRNIWVIVIWSCSKKHHSEQTENFVFCFVWHYQKQLNRGLKIFFIWQHGLYTSIQNCMLVYAMYTAETVYWYTDPQKSSNPQKNTQNTQKIPKNPIKIPKITKSPPKYGSPKIN